MEALKYPYLFALVVLLANTVKYFLRLLHALATDNWIFMYYFDDQKNYVESFSELSIFPLSFQQLLMIFSHVGLNVYEPVGSCLHYKCFCVDKV
jgi:hypothetical protein